MTTTAIVPPRGRLLNFAQAAQYLGMEETRLRRLVAARKIPVLRDGRLGFYTADLDIWMADHVDPADGDVRRKAERQTAPPTTADWRDLMPTTRRFPRRAH